MAYHALDDYLVIKPLTKENKTDSGIILPDTGKDDRPEQGEVVYAGPGRLLDAGGRASMEVKVGDKVVFKKYAPDPVQINGDEYFVIRQSDVILKFD